MNLISVKFHRKLKIEVKQDEEVEFHCIFMNFISICRTSVITH